MTYKTLEQQMEGRLVLRGRCPACQFQQNTTSVRAVTCMRCNTHYTLFPKRKPARLVRIVEGSQALLNAKRGKT